VGPPIGDKNVEMGVGIHGMIGKDQGGAGTVLWTADQVAPGFDVVARGHFAGLFNINPSAKSKSPDAVFGGNLGVRYRYPFTKTLLGGAELSLDYQQQGDFNTGTRLVSGIFGIPVAEQAFEGVWVYTQLNLGVAVPLQPNPPAPFFGFFEVPIGVAWQATPWLLVLAEGGTSIPVTGGYFGLACAFRL
jgi:hypothetical protein